MYIIKLLCIIKKSNKAYYNVMNSNYNKLMIYDNKYKTF